MKILMYGESPAVMTGLAQVSRVICDALVEEGHEVELIGVNHFLEDYDHDRYPFLIHPCPVDVKDGCKNLEVAKERILSGDYDIFFFGCDLGGSDQVFQWRREARKEHEFISIAYCPVDCDQVPADIWLYFDECEVSVTYTNHGKGVIGRYRPDLPISVIYLACHPETFYPLSKEEKREARKKLFNIEDDSTFIVTNVNRNQGRKDLYRTMAIFHEFHKSHPNSVLYMHCQQQDAGGNLPTIAKSIGMRLKADTEHTYAEVIFAPESYMAIWGFSDASMNLVYNASDCLVSTSTGEGWGLSTTDAMCAGLPVIVPENTANLDLIGENEERGWLIKTGGDIDHQIVLYGMTCNPRDIVHADSMLVNMEIVYQTRGTLRLEEKIQKARAWCLQYTPEKIKRQWKNLFAFLAETALPEGANA
jgi:glycosyltransferase involved in cell wall biosynthesis